MTSRILFVFLGFFSFSGVRSQEYTWSNDVAEIIYEHCASCHHENGIGPFPLMTYADLVPIAWEIKHQVEDRHMPPWPADPNYRHFAYENYLSDEEIAIISQWVLDETPIGNLAQAPVPPVFENTESQLESIDLVLEMEPYTLQYNTDEYRWFTIENPFDDTIYVNAIEIIPGLPEVVHHADLSYDLSGNSYYYDQLDELSGFNSNTGSPNYDYYMNAWMAGGNVVKYPENWGIEVLPGSYFVFEIHYGPGGQGLTDLTKMNLKFVTNPDEVRPVYAQWITNGPDETGSYIPANEVSWYTQETGIFWTEYSMISICPHQHYLGASYKVWMETFQGDSIPLIYIPEWHFHWQMYYTFIYPQHIPFGAKIKTLASFDNTEYNEFNPNDPPENVYWGSSTTDEMLMVLAIWSPYEEGDENILMDSTFNNISSQDIQITGLDIYPNPGNTHIYLSVHDPDDIGTTFTIIDNCGRERMKFRSVSQWEYVDISMLSSGFYTIVGSSNNKLMRTTFVKE
jgi:hypothetical protein